MVRARREAAMVAGRHILLVIGGGIAAYKALDLIRRLRERGARVTPVLTRAGAEFVTPLSQRPRWAISSCRGRPT
jgi:phosphopantothenoylcysteine synthetase/decarboxylase